MLTKFKGPGQWFAQAKASHKKEEGKRSAQPALTPLARRRQRKTDA